MYCRDISDYKGINFVKTKYVKFKLTQLQPIDQDISDVGMYKIMIRKPNTEQSTKIIHQDIEEDIFDSSFSYCLVIDNLD